MNTVSLKLQTSIFPNQKIKKDRDNFEKELDSCDHKKSC